MRQAFLTANNERLHLTGLSHQLGAAFGREEDRRCTESAVGGPECCVSDNDELDHGSAGVDLHRVTQFVACCFDQASVENDLIVCRRRSPIENLVCAQLVVVGPQRAKCRCAAGPNELALFIQQLRIPRVHGVDCNDSRRLLQFVSNFDVEKGAAVVVRTTGVTEVEPTLGPNHSVDTLNRR